MPAFQAGTRPFVIPRGFRLIEESRRRAYLDAMQVTTWLPRMPLPFAAPSRPALLAPVAPPRDAPPIALAPLPERNTATPGPREAEAVPAAPAEGAPAARSTRDALRPPPKPVAEAEPESPEVAPPVRVAPPRFALQLLRAGACLVLVELPTGESFQSRDPAYLLLKDLLRAAGLPDSPKLIGEPVRWPLLHGGSLDQGPEAARDFVQGFLAAQMETAPCACLWLVGLTAIRFAAEADRDAYDREVAVDGLGAAWALPGLETLMEEPARKASLWRAMRRVRQRWLDAP